MRKQVAVVFNSHVSTVSKIGCAAQTSLIIQLWRISEFVFGNSCYRWRISSKYPFNWQNETLLWVWRRRAEIKHTWRTGKSLYRRGKNHLFSLQWLFSTRDVFLSLRLCAGFRIASPIMQAVNVTKVVNSFPCMYIMIQYSSYSFDSRGSEQLSFPP